MGCEVGSKEELNKKSELSLFKLNRIKENILKNDILLVELDNIILKFSKSAESERKNNLNLVTVSETLKRKYEKLMKKLMSMVSELSIFQAKKF